MRSVNPTATRQANALHSDIEYLPRTTLETLQRRLLAQAVQRARQTPFFAPRLTALPDVDELAVEQFQTAVPLTGKQDLRTAGTQTWVPGIVGQTALTLATSGTTGTRIALPYSKHDLDTWFNLAARTLWANAIRPDDVVLLPVPLGLFSGGQGMFGGLQRLGCTVVPIGIVHTPVMAELLRGGLGLTPTAIVTLPSHMLRLLDTLPQAGFNPADVPLRLGSFGAETWSEAARARIEDGFGLTAYDSFGIGELCGPGVAAECEFRNGMHVWEDAFLVEIVDPATGLPVPDGTAGELVLSSLFREIFPLLRFRTGDETYLMPDPCPCGRTHRRIGRIKRRLDNILIVTGVNIDLGDVERILYGYAWLGHEFYLTSGDDHAALQVHTELSAGVPAPPNAEALIAAAIRRIYPVHVNVHLYPAGQLERAPGKAQRIRG